MGSTGVGARHVVTDINGWASGHDYQAGQLLKGYNGEGEVIKGAKLYL